MTIKENDSLFKSFSDFAIDQQKMKTYSGGHLTSGSSRDPDGCCAWWVDGHDFMFHYDDYVTSD